MKDFRTLKVWERSHQLTLDIYQCTISFPKEEMYGVTSQIRRSAASIPANIAEGCGKDGSTDMARYFQIAMGSASELEYELLLAHDLHYIPDEVYARLHDELTQIRRMLNSYIQKLRSAR